MSVRLRLAMAAIIGILIALGSAAAWLQWSGRRVVLPGSAVPALIEVEGEHLDELGVLILAMCNGRPYGDALAGLDEKDVDAFTGPELLERRVTVYALLEGRAHRAFSKHWTQYQAGEAALMTRIVALEREAPTPAECVHLSAELAMCRARLRAARDTFVASGL